jgi:uncharacterized membrane protein YheB (UPF0754 family)
MFHIPAIFLLYGVAQIVHILCTYYDHKNNKAQHNDHKVYQQKSDNKINELENIIKKIENGVINTVEDNVDNKIKKKLINQIENDVEHIMEDMIEN